MCVFASPAQPSAAPAGVASSSKPPAHPASSPTRPSGTPTPARTNPTAASPTRATPISSRAISSATARSGGGTSTTRSATASTGVTAPSASRSAAVRPHTSLNGTRRSRNSSAATPSTAAARPGVKRTPVSNSSGSAHHAAVSGPATNAVPPPTTKSTQPSGTIRFGPSEADRHTHLATPRNAGGAATSSYTPRSCPGAPTKPTRTGATRPGEHRTFREDRLTPREVTARYRSTHSTEVRGTREDLSMSVPTAMRGSAGRARSAGSFAVVLGVLVAAFAVTAYVVPRSARGPAKEQTAPVAPAAVRTVHHSVVYELLGAHGARNVTYAAAGSALTQQATVATPWSVQFTRVGPAGRTEFYSIAARNPGPGALRCRIVVDGVVVAERTEAEPGRLFSCAV